MSIHIYIYYSDELRYDIRHDCCVRHSKGICFSYDNIMEWKYDYEPDEFNITVYATSGGKDAAYLTTELIADNILIIS